MTFGRNVLQLNTQHLTKLDLWFYVTVSRWRQWCHDTENCCNLVSQHKVSV